MEISALANETLLAVFGFLTPEELLRCRAVCHRWASLAQHPTLWRRQEVDTEKCNPKLLTAILRFAPCLGLLNVNCDAAEPAGPFWSTLLSTACAIAGLDFLISSAHAVYAALVICRHASLGRLKVLTVNVADTEAAKSLHWERSLCGLLIQISHIQGLEEINLFADESFMDGAVAEFAKQVERAPATAPVSPSLKYLGMCRLDYFAQLLLQWHAETLEEVRAIEPLANGAPSALLLSCLPRLRKLSCTPLENIETLLQCPSLKSLNLHIYPMWNSAEESRLLKACAYLRSAVTTQLRHFTLSACPGTLYSLLKLLPCLEGKEGTAVALRSLTLDLTNGLDEAEEDVLYQQPLVEILHRLSRLTLLDLDSMPVPALLQALDGRALPELVVLLVRLWRPVGESSVDCGHQFIHSEAVRTLLRNYPRLHVIMKDVQFCDGCGCDFCKEGCHAVPDKAWCMLFGHEAGARCDLPHRRYYNYDEEDKECVAFRISTD